MIVGALFTQERVNLTFGNVPTKARALKKQLPSFAAKILSPDEPPGDLIFVIK